MSRHQGKKSTGGFRVRFANVSTQEANKENVEVKARQAARQILWNHLDLRPEQRTLIQALYDASENGGPGSNEIEDHHFAPSNPVQQNEAASILMTHSLDSDSLEDIGSRWSVKWSKKTGKGEKEEHRTLYQCDCGRDNTVFGSKKRHTPLAFTAVWHMLRLLYNTFPEAVFKRMPKLPLHPSVYARALAQLQEGAQSYPGQPEDLRTSNYRWILKQHDIRTLYRQYNRLIGVNMSNAAHLNIDEWLNPQSPNYNPTLTAAVFHYSPRAAAGERFEVCIATDEMKDAAWKYAYQSQVMLDGTFSICNSKLLLFIVMAVDEKAKGVPIAFLLFSAPSGNKQTSAGYDTMILAKLLQKWHEDLENHGKRPSEVLVVVTDTDLKERGALLQVFPHIWLLICKFHIWQSWRNHRNKVLKGKAPFLKEMKTRFGRLEVELLHTTDYTTACNLVAKEHQIVMAMMDDSDTKSVAERALSHLDYLQSYWLTEELWKSWSDFGRHTAAQLLAVDFNGVIPTTNHLESFNGLLKRKHLNRWQRGGRQLRADILMHVLIMKVLPSIFEQRCYEQQEESRFNDKIRNLPGGGRLINAANSPTSSSMVPVAYFCPDECRDAAAQALVQHKQIGVPEHLPEGLIFICFSAFATEYEAEAQSYRIWLGYNGVTACSCPGFEHRMVACKHMRAALLKVESLRQSGIAVPTLPIPKTESEARPQVIPTLQESPLSRAAVAVTDILGRESGAFDGEQDEESGSEPPDWGDLESSITKSVSRAGVDAQSMARLAYELQVAAPKLGDLATYIPSSSSCVTPEQLEDLTCFHQNLVDLAEKMTNLILDARNHQVKPSLKPLARLTNVSQPLPSTSLKRPGSPLQHTRPIPVPFSPEKAQKRKQSYAPH
ncbi:hypothetical protein M422DRAFT_258767 [Sphaerobolus stellatus SS14]|uniref:SWIM-type domain-containing protein n=1 Tax=Sphaerobolus stellatus (strain SS14) TaxID=990650 RepID=A0A0C9UUV6_SPHS4|nr:hypothetical protein M422DRAFT_258767 [Sphaerobolus stellatus SS14]